MLLICIYTPQRREKKLSSYLAGIRSRDEQFQGLSFKFCQSCIAVLTPYPPFTARRASTAWCWRSCPKPRGAAQRTRRLSPNPWGDGPRWSREGPRWGDSGAWGWGTSGARHGACSFWHGTCTGAGGLLISFTAPCVREEGARFGWRCVRHLWAHKRVTNKPLINILNI